MTLIKHHSLSTPPSFHIPTTKKQQKKPLKKHVIHPTPCFPPFVEKNLQKRAQKKRQKAAKKMLFFIIRFILA
jgi:hypothetical protein